MTMRDQIVFFLNGERQEVGSSEAQWMLSDFLRVKRGLTGTKIVCAEGDCGACTVLRHHPLENTSGPAYLPINSCIATVAQMHGSSLVTVEALSSGQMLNPVQEAMVKCHGSQCGFCTPGFVMALSGAVEKKIAERDKNRFNEREAKNALTGNLCRCTGYKQILDAACAIEISQTESVTKRFPTRQLARELTKILREPVRIESDEFNFWVPSSLKDAAKILARDPEIRVLGAATDLGVVHNKRKTRLTSVVSLLSIPELYEIRKSRDGRVDVGARVSLERLRQYCKKVAPEFARFLDVFASPQIKNVATLAGNVANASPIGDTPPFLLVSDAVVHVQGPKGKRDIAIEDFFVGYRTTALKRGELIASISFLPPGPRDRHALYKVSERRDLDISAVNAAFMVRKSGEVRVAFGGIAAIPLRLENLEKIFAKNGFTAKSLDEAIKALHDSTKPLTDVRGSAAYRRVVAENLLRKFARVHLQIDTEVHA